MKDIGRGVVGRMTGPGPARRDARALFLVPSLGDELVVMLITLTLACLLLPSFIESGEPVKDSFKGGEATVDPDKGEVGELRARG